METEDNESYYFTENNNNNIKRYFTSICNLFYFTYTTA